jgi:flagellar biosynthesis protein FliP
MPETPCRDGPARPGSAAGATVRLPNRASRTAGQAGSGTRLPSPYPSPRGRGDRRAGRWLAVGAAAWVLLLAMFGAAAAQETANAPLRIELPEGLSGGPEQWSSPEGLSSAIQVVLLLTVLSLAPAILIMTTCFVRIVVVLSLLRQAIGTQQLPPSQVITALSLFITLLIMTPVWKQVYDDAVVPYTNHQIGLEEAWASGAAPIRTFMAKQIERTGNREDVWLFMNYVPGHPTPQTYDDVPIQVLVPAFMLSELKTAFLIGFQIYLPFLILDMVIAAVMVSMGMLMLPPVLISLPFKLLLFVLVDGWHLVVGMLMESFQPFV